MTYLLAYDIGTTGVKTCLFGVDDTIHLLADASRSYPLYILPDGGAEQSGDDWWQGMCASTRELFSQTDITPCQVSGISFCSQMQGLVLVDKDGVPVHRPMSYMDQRAKDEIKKGIANGLQVAGANIFKLIPSLIITGAVSSSVKDPVWKYKWVEAHEPENFKRAYKWLDVKDYLICRCTGEFTMTEDSAFATLIYDTRPGKQGWSRKMCRMFGVNTDHLPPIIRSTDKAGALTERAAAELGLVPGTPVFGGGGDSSLIGVGAGCVNVGDTHIYSGTSGWVITVTDRQMVDVTAMIAAITGAQPGKYNYFAEMETAGKCLEWVKDHLALDEVGVYLDKTDVTQGYESTYTSLYAYLTDAVKDVPPGSGGVIFTPWLHGNRCPFEDPHATGMFFGVKLETGKTELIHAVLEGVFYHLRWMLACQDRKIKTSDPIRFVGGGALSPVSCQMLADILGRRIETVASPQNVGSVGAAAVTAVGLGIIPDLNCVQDFIPAVRTYEPDSEKHRQYEPYYQTFKKLYKANRKLYKAIEEDEA
ncbi:MAG: FGGY-family carbohydrate kinase [Clostridiales bacterium]|nr:FGGY-family carbohydrate kinase [Candidatus Cacconaster stercorequi]